MPFWSAGQPQPYEGFAKGIDRDSPRTMVADGHYEDGLNILLTSATSGQHAATMKVDSELDPTITWQTGNVYWFQPYTFATFNSTDGVLAFETHLVIQRDTGAYWRYDFGAPGTETLVRRLGAAAVQQMSHLVYDQYLVILNGRDAPMKYGQHFRYDGQGHTQPYMFPLGSKPISPLCPSITGETWAFTGSTDFVADASVPGGGARVGTHALKVSPVQSARVTFATARNFLAGPLPYGGTNFATTDYFVNQVLRTSGSAGYTIKFHKTFNSVYLQFALTPGTAGEWTTKTTLISAGTAVGGFSSPADLAAITDITIENGSASDDLYIDDLYLLYANAPPAAAVGAAHKDRIVLGGAPLAGDNSDPALSTIFYSPASKPDEFPGSNQQIISGGAQSLSRTNRITVLREYGDSVITGTQNAIIAWTIGTDGSPSRSVVTTEIGMDSPRAVVETPSGSLLFNWQRGFYLLRQTGRNYVSDKIAPLLNDIWLEQPWWTMGVRDEKTRSIRFWFRELVSGDPDPSVTTSGVVFDYARAQDTGDAVWPSRMSQMADFATEAYIDGARETLYSRYNSQKIFLMGSTSGGILESSLTLPWLGVGTKDQVGRYIGISVPYAATADVTVYARYAQHPSEFDTAPFEAIQTLVANPDPTQPARVNFGKTARWIQIKLQAQEYGFELYPPFALIEGPTTKRE